ncbi:hypothetical protein [Kistimonas asteriae]|uniref:hypothetical protein n=1 Tax=Kistimonas asteriae TaxID=517724 RepID=UPI001BA9271D|nr:hypothetical protein [Kistimonas asteriae]
MIRFLKQGRSSQPPAYSASPKTSQHIFRKVRFAHSESVTGGGDSSRDSRRTLRGRANSIGACFTSCISCKPCQPKEPAGSNFEEDASESVLCLKAEERQTEPVDIELPTGKGEAVSEEQERHEVSITAQVERHLESIGIQTEAIHEDGCTSDRLCHRFQQAERNVADTGVQAGAELITAEKYIQTESKEPTEPPSIKTSIDSTEKLKTLRDLRESGMLGELEKLELKKLEKLDNLKRLKDESASLLGGRFILIEDEVCIESDVEMLRKKRDFCGEVLAYEQGELIKYLKRDAKDASDDLIEDRKKQLRTFYKEAPGRVANLEADLITNKESLKRNDQAFKRLYHQLASGDLEPLLEDIEAENEQSQPQAVAPSTGRNETGIAESPDRSGLPQEGATVSTAQPVAASSTDVPDNRKKRKELEQLSNEIEPLESAIAAIQKELDKMYQDKMLSITTYDAYDEASMLTSIIEDEHIDVETSHKRQCLRRQLIMKSKELTKLRERRAALKSIPISEKKMLQEKNRKVTFDVTVTSPVTTVVAETVTESTQTEGCKQEEKNTQTEEETKKEQQRMEKQTSTTSLVIAASTVVDIPGHETSAAKGEVAGRSKSMSSTDDVGPSGASTSVIVQPHNIEDISAGQSLIAIEVDTVWEQKAAAYEAGYLASLGTLEEGHQYSFNLPMDEKQE